jgi:hypothetical protein
MDVFPSRTLSTIVLEIYWKRGQFIGKEYEIYVFSHNITSQTRKSNLFGAWNGLTGQRGLWRNVFVSRPGGRLAVAELQISFEVSYYAA